MLLRSCTTPCPETPQRDEADRRAATTQNFPPEVGTRRRPPLISHSKTSDSSGANRHSKERSAKTSRSCVLETGERVGHVSLSVSPGLLCTPPRCQLLWDGIRANSLETCLSWAMATARFNSPPDISNIVGCNFCWRQDLALSSCSLVPLLHRWCGRGETGIRKPS